MVAVVTSAQSTAGSERKDNSSSISLSEKPSSWACRMKRTVVPPHPDNLLSLRGAFLPVQLASASEAFACR